jgi:hypothetical protein
LAGGFYPEIVEIDRQIKESSGEFIKVIDQQINRFISSLAI